ASSEAAAMSFRIEASRLERSLMLVPYAVPDTPSVIRDRFQQEPIAIPDNRSATSGMTTLPESGLGLADERLEGRRLTHRQIRKNLAVDLDARFAETGDEAGIGQAALADRGVDALDPECAECALLVL